MSKTLEIGSIYQFGGYDWRVLDVEDNRALLISEKILAKRPYNTEQKNITWENCTLRNELNAEFYNQIPHSDRIKIVKTPVENKKNEWYNTDAGNNTEDYIFLLSIEESEKYFGNTDKYHSEKEKSINRWREIGGAMEKANEAASKLDSKKPYPHSEGFKDIDHYMGLGFFSTGYEADRVATYGKNEPCSWWLRTPGPHKNHATTVCQHGMVWPGVGGNVVEKLGVRPALWLNLDA